MSILSTSTKGRLVKPLFFGLHATSGVGKTTFATQAPNPILLETEDGSNHLDIERVKIKSPHMLLEVLEELLKSEHEFKTVIIDSLDQLELMIHEAVALENGKTNIEHIGFAKGYIFALTHWQRVFSFLNELRNNRNMNVILICHSQVRSANDPAQPEPYDEYSLKLHKKAAAFIMENVDALFFLTYKMIFKDSKRAIGSGERIMYTEQRPGWQAKNRYGLPHKLNLDWKELITEIKKQH